MPINSNTLYVTVRERIRFFSDPATKSKIRTEPIHKQTLPPTPSDYYFFPFEVLPSSKVWTQTATLKSFNLVEHHLSVFSTCKRDTQIHTSVQDSAYHYSCVFSFLQTPRQYKAHIYFNEHDDVCAPINLFPLGILAGQNVPLKSEDFAELLFFASSYLSPVLKEIQLQKKTLLDDLSVRFEQQRATFDRLFWNTSPQVQVNDSLSPCLTDLIRNLDLTGQLRILSAAEINQRKQWNEILQQIEKSADHGPFSGFQFDKPPSPSKALKEFGCPPVSSLCEISQSISNLDITESTPTPSSNVQSAQTSLLKQDVVPHALKNAQRLFERGGHLMMNPQTITTFVPDLDQFLNLSKMSNALFTKDPKDRATEKQINETLDKIYLVLLNFYANAGKFIKYHISLFQSSFRSSVMTKKAPGLPGIGFSGEMDLFTQYFSSALQNNDLQLFTAVLKFSDSFNQEITFLHPYFQSMHTASLIDWCIIYEKFEFAELLVSKSCGAIEMLLTRSSPLAQLIEQSLFFGVQFFLSICRGYFCRVIQNPQINTNDEAKKFKIIFEELKCLLKDIRFNPSRTDPSSVRATQTLHNLPEEQWNAVFNNMTEQFHYLFVSLLFIFQKISKDKAVFKTHILQLVLPKISSFTFINPNNIQETRRNSDIFLTTDKYMFGAEMKYIHTNNQALKELTKDADQLKKIALYIEVFKNSFIENQMNMCLQQFHTNPKLSIHAKQFLARFKSQQEFLGLDWLIRITQVLKYFMCFTITDVTVNTQMEATMQPLHKKGSKSSTASLDYGSISSHATTTVEKVFYQAVNNWFALQMLEIVRINSLINDIELKQKSTPSDEEGIEEMIQSEMKKEAYREWSWSACHKTFLIEMIKKFRHKYHSDNVDLESQKIEILDELLKSCCSIFCTWTE